MVSTPADASTIRSFIAIEIEGELRRAVLRTRDRLRMVPADVSWVPDENIHLTLAFLGDIRPELAHQLSAVLDQVLETLPRFNLGLAGIGAFGREQSPRVIWAGTEPSDQLASVCERVAGAARGLDIPLEDRPIHPHITIGRVRSGRGRNALGTAIKQHADAGFGNMEVGGVALMKSILEPQGAVYHRLHEARLAAG